MAINSRMIICLIRRNIMAEVNGVKNITDSEFEEVTGNGLSLVDFWAPWCYPCRIQGSILEKVVEKVGDKVRLYKLNVDENTENAGKYGISGIPSLLIFKDGQMVKQYLGVQEENELVSTLESFL
jgi:thioredoxin 1